MLILTKNNPPVNFTNLRAGYEKYLFSGERGIRTPGTSQFNGFQDRRNRPLCHLSLLFVKRCKDSVFLEISKIYQV